MIRDKSHESLRLRSIKGEDAVALNQRSHSLQNSCGLLHNLAFGMFENQHSIRCQKRARRELVQSVFVSLLPFVWRVHKGNIKYGVFARTNIQRLRQIHLEDLESGLNIQRI